MTRYIKLDEWEKHFDKMMTGCPLPKKTIAKIKQMWIDGMPTADVVEVVRCRECKHLYKAIGSILVNGEKETFTYNGLCGATYPNVTVRDFDHYCSYGERRE